MNFRFIVIVIIDIFRRELPVILNRYRPFAFGKKGRGRYVFMADGTRLHGGMFDRLKGIVSIYALAKAQGKEFKICFDHPFELSDYLVPNQYDWRVTREQLTYRYPASRPYIVYGECYSPWRLLRNHKGECHFYYGYNSLKEINAKYGTAYEWTALYNELFKPAPHLQEQIDYYRQEISGRYVVTHFRFLNLLGDKTETEINPVLPREEQEALKRKCREAMTRIAVQHEGCRLMLATDSTMFVEYIHGEMPDVYVIPGEIKHVGTAGSTTDLANLKMFLDYYIIGGAVKVYGLVAEGMWPSAFPEYAAMIGGVEFERISL